jgi:hypothetical protein
VFSRNNHIASDRSFRPEEKGFNYQIISWNFILLESMATLLGILRNGNFPFSHGSRIISQGLLSDSRLF